MLNIILPEITLALYAAVGALFWENIKLHSVISGDDDLDMYRAEASGTGAAWSAAITIKVLLIAAWPLVMSYCWIAGRLGWHE